MKYLFIFLLALSVSVQAQESKDPSPDFYITTEGEKVFMYGEIEMSAQFLFYDDARGKRSSEAQKKVEVMLAKSRLFLNLPITKNMLRMHELIAFDEKHLLTFYFGESVYYIFDRNKNMLEGRVNFYGSDKKCLALLDDKIAPYFGGCKELMNALRKNITDDKLPSDQITYFQCGEKDFFD